MALSFSTEVKTAQVKIIADALTIHLYTLLFCAYSIASYCQHILSGDSSGHSWKTMYITNSVHSNTGM